MKVMIEAEIVDCGKGSDEYWIRADGKYLIHWHELAFGPQAGKWLATRYNGKPPTIFPSEPAARAWVLEQLNAKEVQP